MGVYKQNSTDRNIGDFTEAAAASSNTVLADGSWKLKSEFPALASAIGDPLLFDGSITTDSSKDFETYNDICGGNNVAVISAASTNPAGYTVILQSPDGKKWKRSAVLSGTPSGYRKVYFASGRFFAPTSAGTYTSTDGLSWTKISSYIFSRLAYNGTIWVGSIYNQSTTKYYTSTDLVEFTERTAPANMAEVAFSGGNFVFVVGSSTNSYRSADGINWTSGGSTTQSSISGRICEANGVLFIPTSANEVARYSTNGGQSWASCGGSKTYTWGGTADVVFDGTYYFLSTGNVGDNNYMYWYASSPSSFSAVQATNGANWYVTPVYTGSFAITTFFNVNAYVSTTIPTSMPAWPSSDSNWYPMMWNGSYGFSTVRRTKNGVKYQAVAMRDSSNYAYTSVRIEGADGYFSPVSYNGYNYLNYQTSSGETDRYTVMENGAEYSVFSITTTNGSTYNTNWRFAVNKTTFNSTRTNTGHGGASYTHYIDVGDSLLLTQDTNLNPTTIYYADGTYTTASNYGTNFTSIYSTFINDSGMILIAGSYSTTYQIKQSLDYGKTYTQITPKVYTSANANVTIGSGYAVFYTNGFYYLCYGDKVYRGISFSYMQESASDMPIVSSDVTGSNSFVPYGKDIISKYPIAWNGNGIKHKGLQFTFWTFATIQTGNYPSFDGYKILTLGVPSTYCAKNWYVKYDKDPSLYFKVPAVASSAAGKSMCIIAK